MKSDMDTSVFTLMRETAQKLRGISDDQYLQEAILKMAMRDFALALEDAFEDTELITVQLELVAQALREDRFGYAQVVELSQSETSKS